MTLPIPPNVTFDLYRGDNSPPGTPDVSAAGYLRPAFTRGLEAGEGLADTGQRFSHLLMVDPSCDVRDLYHAGTLLTATSSDFVYVPDQEGTPFRVVFVERRLRGSPFDHLRVFLSRGEVAWPSVDV